MKKELDRKIRNKKLLALLAIILGWIPLIGWGFILYALLSYYRLLSQIPDDSYLKDLKTIRIRALIAMFLLPLGLILFGFLLVIFGN
jgi:uncharacterized membrane protein YidH (DUF202 family)